MRFKNLNFGGAQTHYIGIDHHRQYLHITLSDEKGGKLKSGRVANLPSELEIFLSNIEEVKAVVEAGRSRS